MHIAAYNNQFETVEYLYNELGASILIDNDNLKKTCLDNSINAGNNKITNWLQGKNFFKIFFKFF
jgi:ankyrin repeat protein